MDTFNIGGLIKTEKKSNLPEILIHTISMYTASNKLKSNLDLDNGEMKHKLVSL